MPEVPAAYIKNKPVNFVAEIFGCLGSPLGVGSLVLPPPTAGCFALLEMIDSRFFRDYRTASFLETGRALAIFRLGRGAVGMVRDYVDDRPDELDAAAQTAMEDGGPELVDRLAEVAEWLLVSPFTGYEMIPGGTRSATQFLFDGVILGSIAMLGGKYAGLTPMATLWEVPLTLLGHIAQVTARANGVQGVGRPKDPDDIRLQLKLAGERDARGEPHPWQIDDPEHYGPGPAKGK